LVIKLKIEKLFEITTLKKHKEANKPSIKNTKVIKWSMRIKNALLT